MLTHILQWFIKITTVNISVQFIFLICMYKNNVNFVFVATELQHVKFLYYPVLLNSLQYLIGVYV